MVEITKTFKYKVADDYLAQTNNLNKEAEWTYIGPDKIWVFVNNKTKFIFDYPYKTEKEDGETYPTPLGYTKIMIDCNDNPLLGVLISASSYYVDINSLPQKEINLPNGNIYKRPITPDPMHTYEHSEIKYDNDEWIIPWKKPWVTWETIYNFRDGLLKNALIDQRNITTLPDSLKNKLEEYIDSIQKIETEWANYEPYMYVFPDYPL